MQRTMEQIESADLLASAMVMLEVSAVIPPFGRGSVTP
jgi:hypothetical protein